MCTALKSFRYNSLHGPNCLWISCRCHKFINPLCRRVRYGKTTTHFRSDDGRGIKPYPSEVRKIHYLSEKIGADGNGSLWDSIEQRSPWAVLLGLCESFFKPTKTKNESLRIVQENLWLQGKPSRN